MKKCVQALIISAALCASCGNDDDDNATSVSPEISSVCMTECAKAMECELLQAFGISLADCQAQCEDINTMLTKDCAPTEAEAAACRAAYEAQSCQQIEMAETPDACVKTCPVEALRRLIP